MAGRTMQGFLIGILLAGSLGAVLFVFVVLREGETGFASTQREAAEKPPRKSRVRRRPRNRRPNTTQPSEREKADPEPEVEEGRPISPPDPEAVPGERAELTLELVRPKEDEDRRIVVTVTDEEGVAIQNALVVFRSGASIVYRERADEDGIAEFDPYEEEEGPFRVDAIADRFAAGNAPEVKPGAAISLVLKMQPWIEGRVIAPAVGHGVVTLFTEHGRRKAAVQNNGTFLFEEVEPGWVTVQAVVEPYGVDTEQFELHAGTRRFVRLRVRAKSRVTLYGDIIGWNPAGKAWINGVRLAVSSQGRYIFEKGIFGTNEILIDVPHKALFQKRFHVSGRKRHENKFRLERDAYIGGRVYGGDDRARVEGAEVRVGIDFDNPLNKDGGLFPIQKVPIVYTNDKGYFKVTRLQRGLQYVISIVQHPYAQYMGDFPAKNIDRHVITLPTGPFLFGRLHGLGGVPRNATITAYRLLEDPDPRKFNVGRWDKVSSDRDRKGFYGLSGLMPDIYVIRAEAPGYGAAETVVDLRDLDRGRMDLRVRKGDFQTTDDAQLLRRLPPVVETEEEFGDAPRGEVTAVTIDVRRAENKVPFPGVKVRFFEGELEFTAPMSFDRDQFDLIGLPEATYRAVLTHPLLDKPIVRTEIKLRRGEPFTIVLRDG
jgi:hypothetical protein